MDSTLQTFEQDVIQASMRHLVLVDFWAPWCGPCRSLGPILERVVDDLGDAVSLVKINTDEEQSLASQFGIRSLPTVVLFRHGEPIDSFMGAQPESMIRRLLDKHADRPSDMRMASAFELWSSGDRQRALGEARTVLVEDAGNDRARLTLAGWLAEENLTEEASEVLAAASSEVKTEKAYLALTARLELLGSSDLEASAADLVDTLERNDDLETRYRLALALVRENRLEEAVDNLLIIIERDRRFRGDEPRQAILRIFESWGDAASPIIGTYRRRLARLLN